MLDGIECGGGGMDVVVTRSLCDYCAFGVLRFPATLYTLKCS